MGNAFSISCNPINCTINVDQEVRFLLCPARDSEELHSEMATLRRTKEAVEKQIPELEGLPGVVVRDELRGWIATVDTLDGQVSALLCSLRRRSPCFRFLCCCSYPQNYDLGKRVRDKLTETQNLKAEHDRWNGILVRPIEPLRSPEVAMGDELKKLEALKKDLETYVEEEIVKAGVRKQKSNALTDWSRKVDRLVSEVRGSVNEQMMARVRKEIKDLIEEGEMIRNKGDLVIMKLPDKIPYLSVPDFLVGIEDDISKIFGFLKDDRTSVIGIHGMGGAGKTTLVKEMVKRLRSPEPQVEFDLVAFAVVSQTPNILKIQEAIGDRLGYSWNSDTAGNDTYNNRVEMERKEILRERLYRKRFLLILDDVWNELDLEKIGVPPLDNGTNSKIMLTTRELKVCGFMDCKEKLHVGKLGKEDSQKLFYRMCNKDDKFFKIEKEICKIADEILSKCGGLPLVIRTVARALANTSTVKDWRDAIRLFHHFPDSFAEKMEIVFKLLKISFDYLKMDEHRSCLLSFALYPEDKDIRIEEIIRYWIAEGLLEFTRCWKLEDLEACGRRLIIETLQNACLLEKGSDDDHVKMHDTIREMLIWLGNKEDDYKNHKFLPYKSWEEKNEQPVVDGKWKDVERVYFIKMHKVDISSGGISSAFLSLQTLIFKEASLVDLPAELFTFTPNLRVLDLSWNSKLQRLPESLWSLKNLRYMDLSFTGLAHIPEGIGSLTSLQFLYLRSCEHIKQIRVEVGQLTNLVGLNLSFNKYDGIPYLALASLSKLQILDLYYTSLSSSDRGRMKELDINLVRLSNLSLTLRTLEDVQQLRECHVLNKSIRKLLLHSIDELSTADVSSLLSGLSGLKVLEIHNCWGLEGTLQLPGHSLQKLEKLFLYTLPLLSCLEVESNYELPNLVMLYMQNCDQLRDARCLLQLPNLETLEVNKCNGMVEVIPSKEEETTTETEASSSSVQNIHQIGCHPYYFPKLESIGLGGLPCLESISKVRLHLPSLKNMYVSFCPKLRKLPAIEFDNKPVTIRCEKAWWEELQWEEDAAHHLITSPLNNFLIEELTW